jgi:trk system potassium uptake protein
MTASTPSSVKPKSFLLEPAVLITLSFALTILLGGTVLWLPISLEPGVRLSFLDAVFTATSAVCVTGLNVIDPGKTFSVFGEIVLMVLIFLGGIGVITAGTFVALVAGRRMGFAERVRVNEAIGGNTGNAGSVVFTVLGYAATIQFIGFVLLWIAWSGQDVEHAAYMAAFHSVSAFNNAGFSLWPDNLVRFAGDPWTNLIVSALIILGGLGFLVYMNLRLWRLDSIKYPLKLTTRIVLFSTAALLVIGTVVYLLLEWGNPKTLGALEPWQRIHAAFFMSVTPRTAGFNTVDYDLVTHASTFVTLILMFIGASPASTGGGIKTSTFFMLLLSAISFVRYGGEPTVFGRRIDLPVILKALAVTFLGVQLVGVAFTLLSLTEPTANPVKIVFETVSAFATVGLSMNFTSTLSEPGRMIVIALMFLGRVGILTFALALTGRQATRKLRYPNEDVVIG